MPNPVVHWEIAVNDLEKSKQFYTQLFDWQVDTNNPLNYGLTKTGGLNGGLFPRPQGVPNYVTFYVAVGDIDASLQKAVALGGKLIIPRMPIPGIGEFGMFADPDGNMIGVFKGLASA